MTDISDITDVEAIDYFTDQSLAADPYPYLDYLVEERPVWREPHHGVVLVTGYEEVLAVYRDPETYSSSVHVSGPEPKFPVEFEGDDITEVVEQYRDGLLSSDQIVTFDPPKHTAHRALIMGLITPKRLRENEEFMWRLCDRKLDEILPGGSCEFVADYCQGYTLLVIADLLGVPEADHEALLKRMGRDRGGRLPGDVNPGVAAHGGLEGAYQYFIDAIGDRRSNPRGDVLSGMAQATFPDGTTPELLDCARIASNMFGAGQETTVRLLTAALRRIADEPELQANLRADRALIPSFVEETLRIEAPGKGAFRLVRKSTTLGGVDLPAGTTVMLLRGAACRDPRRFECPAEFRMDRPNGRHHLAFGHGIHTCPGAPLARSEGRVTIERFFDRTSDIRLSEAAHGPEGQRRFDYLPSFMFRGLTELHLEYTPID
jgi:cytochrome P450